MRCWVRPTSCRYAHLSARCTPIEYSPWVVPRTLTLGERDYMNTNMLDGERIVFVLFIVFGCIGLMNLLFPRLAWFLKMGWQFRGKTEPSALWIISSRIGGLIIAAVCFYGVASMYDPDTTEKITHDIRQLISGSTTNGIGAK